MSFQVNAEQACFGWEREAGSERQHEHHLSECSLVEGANPADLPVEQPTKVQMLVNLRTARALGFEVPLSLLLRADELIE